MPEAFLIRVAAEIGIDLPPRNYYGVGMAFLPQDADVRGRVKKLMDEVRVRMHAMRQLCVCVCVRERERETICALALYATLGNAAAKQAIHRDCPRVQARLRTLGFQ